MLANLLSCSAFSVWNAKRCVALLERHSKHHYRQRRAYSWLKPPADQHQDETNYAPALLSSPARLGQASPFNLGTPWKNNGGSPASTAGAAV